MAHITPVPVDQALTPSRKAPSARTLRTRQLEQDAAEVAQAVDATGAAMIDVTAEEGPADRYLSGLRSALSRLGYTQILLQKRRGRDQIAAWRERSEDRARIETRRRRGLELGQMARERADKGRRTRRSAS